MTHYAIEHWTDFARGLVTGQEREAMQAHLHTCPSCKRQLEQLQQVVGFARREAEAPDPLIARAISIFEQPTAVSKWRKLTALLEFDSFSEAAVAGVRSGHASARRLVFTAEDCRIELLIESAEQLVSLAGQVSMRSVSQSSTATEIVLEKGRRALQRTMTNEHGEFHMETEFETGLRLRITDSLGGRKLEVVLPKLT